MKSVKKLETTLAKNKKYLLACSFGPDSMALFDYLIKNDYEFEIVHVNYHILNQADDDEKGIKDFAKKYGIKVHVLSTAMPDNVNEESWAREVRYNFFDDVGTKENIKDVLVAHNLDDLVETYYLQKERGTHLFYGIKDVNIYKNINVIRPLLHYRKRELQEYCKINNVPFSIDPSNEDIKFRRNYFRQKLQELSDEEIETILKDIEKNNVVLQGFLKKFDKNIFTNELRIDSIILETISVREFQILLIYFLKKNNQFKEISYTHAKDLLEKFKNKKNFSIPLNDEFELYFEYGVIGIFKKATSYLYYLSDLKEDSIFLINKNHDLYKTLNLDDSCYIAPAYHSEFYEYKGMRMKVNREFISWKLPLHLRKLWPGIYTKEGHLVYLPRYREKFEKKENLLSFDIKDII